VRKISIFRKAGGGIPIPGLPNVTMEEMAFEQSDALMAEIASFVDAVRAGTAPLVSGEDGKRALELAMQISRKLWHEVTP
jgi:predicted dehydrogenase